ncbi:polyprotein 2 [Red clover torradovirus 1]|nr:polyprotein 2 [Red clover torradovirus 1]
MNQRRLKASQQLQMPTSLNHGQEMAMSTNSQDTLTLTNQIHEFFDAVATAQSNSKKNGMGCFTIVRANSGKPISAELMELEDVNKVTHLWDRLRFRKVKNKDSFNQYFHLHGVVFIMVPHVTEQDGGEVKISLFSGNNPHEVLDSKILPLGKGPAVVVMSSPICVPLLANMHTFYYTVACSGSQAFVPCSVMAMWKQEITTKAAIYKRENVATWALEKLSHMQMIESSAAAARLISTHYGSGDIQADVRPQPFLNINKSVKKLDVGAILDLEAQNSQTCLSHKMESKRFGSINIPTVPECQFQDEEDNGQSVSTTHLHKHLRAQSTQSTDKAYFNVAMGFCGRQQNDTEFGSHLLNFQSWIKEEAAIQKAFNGEVIPFTVCETSYYDIGILPKKMHFLKLILEDGVEVSSLKEDYSDEVEAFETLTKDISLEEMQKLEEMYLKQLEQALSQLCNPDPCSCSLCVPHVEEIEVYEDALPEFLTAQATDIVVDNTIVAPVNSFNVAVTTSNEVEKEFLDAMDDLFDFSSSVVDSDFLELPVCQPLAVQSNTLFEVGVFEFNWPATTPQCTQLLEVPLPEAFNKKNSLNPAGVELLRFFDAGILEFHAEVNLSASFAVTGELVLVWDEGDVLGKRLDTINQASLLTVNYMIVSAVQSVSSELIFTPTGVGKFVPFDTMITSSRLGSLRLFILYPIQSDEPTTSFPGHVHLRAKMLASNIMQAPRMLAQSPAGMPIQASRLSEINCSQILFSSQWPTTSKMGESLVCTFSPSSVFEQDSVLQPSLLCNLFRNCKWWTGECEFELHFDKSAFHAGSLGIGFGTIASDLHSQYDIFNTAHVIANLSDHHTFRFSISLHSWNGKNLLSTGRKSSLPKIEHYANLRIFATVIKPLVTTNKALNRVNFHLMLKRIKNLEVGGSTPIRPVFGHWKEGKSGTDFFYSESDGPQAELLTELLKKNLPSTPAPRSLSAQALIPLREKMRGSVRQYIVPKIDKDKRYLVLPVAPWTYEFKDKSVISSEVNPLIDACSSFLYWKGSLEYTLIIHRKQGSPNVGGIMIVAYEASGYPIEPGLHTGKQPISSGGARHWNLAYSSDKLVHKFTVEDDQFFLRRYTRYQKFDDTKSRLDTFTDRLGNLIIYLPSSECVNQLEIQIGLGKDFVFSQVRVPAAASEKSVGDMTSHVYKLDRDKFTAVEGQTNVLKV